MTTFVQSNPQLTLETNKSSTLQPIKKLSMKSLTENNPNMRKSLPKFQINKQSNSHTNNKKQQPIKKMSLPLKEFQYGEKTFRTVKKSRSQLKYNPQKRQSKFQWRIDRMPIKIIQDKIQLEEYLNRRNSERNSARSSHRKVDEGDSQAIRKEFYQTGGNTSQLLGQPRRTATQNAILTAKQLLELKQKLYNPKPHIFDRYNYQNYQNYKYKNPFTKHKYESLKKDSQNNLLHKFPTNSKYKLHKGSQKNLEIVFCQTKYQQFVIKTNQIYQKQLQKESQIKQAKSSYNVASSQYIEIVSPKSTARSIMKNLQKNVIQYQNVHSRELFNKKNFTKWNYSQYNSKTLLNTHYGQSKTDSPFINRKNVKNLNMILNKKKLKSTLENHLQTFKTLERISQIQQKQQISSRTNLKLGNFGIPSDFSKTVLLDVVINKYTFFKRLNKSFRNHLLRVLFQIDEINQVTKISIHDYLKLLKIFIVKDSTIEELASFVFRLLFSNGKEISFENGKTVLQRINNGKKKLQIIIQQLYKILNQPQQNKNINQIISRFQTSPYWLNSIIDYILNQ